MDSSNVDSPNVDSSNVDSSSTSDLNTSKRMHYNQLAEEIIRFCSLEYKSSEQIATHIKRSEKYLKNNILTKMIRDGKLLKLYADNHPNQKYTAKK
ncbi:hypothetical protein [Sphingobacterium haloxyli]|uniref:Uncharacterized protein n=1 Tax=Sphingobacterium haloxyli TaxID=2100533 RepID=A0A2S9J4D5_9SPHI|nr:hypothetical protein [Sphingobacterium haloxyli]PRD47614.1 hypothetical protein C5745_09910 [Sphingobacterium haloxyli]